MINLLKKDFYIVLKSKYWLILLSVCSIFTLLFTVVTHNMADMSLDNAGANFAETAFIFDETEKTVFSYCEAIICSDALVMFIGIFSIMLIMQEFNSLYIKNIWPTLKHKGCFLLSKFVVFAVYILLVFVVAISIISLLCVFAFSIDSFGEIDSFLIMCLKQYLLELSYGALCMLLALLIRKQLVVVIAHIVYVSMGQTLIYTGIDLAVSKLFDYENFEVGNYLLIGNIERLTMTCESADSIRGIIIAGACLLIFIVASYLSLTKKDVI